MKINFQTRRKKGIVIKMGWVCDRCSTYNVDEVSKCFVCDFDRTEESIREAKRAKRAERIKLGGKIAAISGKVLFFVSIILFSVFAGITVYFKAKEGALGDVGGTLIGVGGNIADNFKTQFYDNINALVHQLLNSPMMDTVGNLKEMYFHALNGLKTDGKVAALEMLSNFGLRAEGIYQNLVDVKDGISEVAQGHKSLGAIIKDNALEAIQVIRRIASVAFEKVSEFISTVAFNADEILWKLRERF